MTATKKATTKTAIKAKPATKSKASAAKQEAAKRMKAAIPESLPQRFANGERKALIRSVFDQHGEARADELARELSVMEARRKKWFRTWQAEAKQAAKAAAS
ncbi:hypothetical protein [Methyloceanibacter marginalis]|nr:hypothetical protein [Methyloceanibacter marginalis]